MNKFIKEQKDTIVRKNVNVLKDLDESNKKNVNKSFLL